MVVETLFLLFCDELTEIQRAGTRILTCIEPVDLLARMFPTEDLKRRTDVAVELLSAARAAPLHEPRRHRRDVPDRLPGQGAVRLRRQARAVGPLAVGRHGADLRRGRRHRRPRRRRPRRHPASVQAVRAGADRVHDRGGRITDIRGDGYQAELVRQYIADFDDPDAYGLSHIGWGLDERAKWAALATDSRGHGMELRAFYGNVLFSTGPNDLVGGPNHSSCHLDIPMRNCSLYSTTGR